MKLTDIFLFELKRNYKLFMWWIIAWAGMILLLLPFYDTFINGSGDFAQLFENLLEAFKVAFSIDAESFSSIAGYINTELTEILILSGSIFGLYLGVRSIGREISNKSLLFVISKPVERITVYSGKILNILFSLYYLTLFYLLLLLLELSFLQLQIHQQNIFL